MRSTSVGQTFIAVVFMLLTLVPQAALGQKKNAPKSAPSSQAAPPAEAPAPAPAAPVFGLKYDPATEVTLKGSIDDMQELSDPAGQAHIKLLLKTGQGLTEVRLCPREFLDALEFALAKGDDVEITGSRVKVDDKEIVLGRTVVKGNNILVLRDKKGNPAWTWLKK